VKTTFAFLLIVAGAAVTSAAVDPAQLAAARVLFTERQGRRDQGGL